MPLTLNGSAITVNTLNGTAVATETLNGSTVYSSGGSVQTPTPDIIYTNWYKSGYDYILEWEGQNNDDVTSTLYGEYADSTPDLYSRNVGAGGSWIFNQNVGQFFTEGTVYVQALTSGKTLSEYASAYINAIFG